MKPQVAPALIAVLAAGFVPTAHAGKCPCEDRPDFTAAIDSLAADIVARTPEFKHIDTSRILFVAADARHASRATTRPTRFPDGAKTSADGKWARPTTVWNGKEVAYIVELRPRFLRRSTVEARIKTLFHELRHMSPSFDGTIPDGNSHKRGPDDGFDASIRPFVKRYLAQANPALLMPLAFDGEVMVRQWLERPPNKFLTGRKDAKRRYGHADVFLGPVELLTSDSALKRALGAGAKGKFEPPVDLDGD
ncbi:MAG: hypothetical protein HY897_12595 [Deltaproteobacteria bacterium]|nr:hypothetical protein [Deltaproteobacteria bacterium]